MWRVVVPTKLTSLRYLSARTLFASARYSTAEINMAVQTEPTISKEALLKMRKETGYSYVKCRRALVECGGEQNYEQALRWIKEAAVKEGWNKAVKLSSRKASQGLIGYASPTDNLSIIIELNCETDFAATSAEFKKLVAELVNALNNHFLAISTQNEGPQKLIVTDFEPDKFRLLDGRTAEEAILAAITKIGENIRLARATVISSPSEKLFGETHPKEEFDGVQIGHFVSLVALNRTSKDDISGLPITQLAHHICQHIIGMAPDSLGEPGKKRAHQAMDQKHDTPEEAKKEQTTNAETESDPDEEEDLNASQVDQSELTRMDETEAQLLHQPFMFDPDQTVNEYLDQFGANISYFVRIKMGEENVSTGGSTA